MADRCVGCNGGSPCGHPPYGLLRLLPGLCLRGGILFGLASGLGLGRGMRFGLSQSLRLCRGTLLGRAPARQHEGGVDRIIAQCAVCGPAAEVGHAELQAGQDP